MFRLAIGVVAASAVALVLSGCLGVSHGHVFQVSIANNTQQPVVVRDCDSFCSSSPIAIVLQPGASTPINRIAHDHKFFSITSTTGDHIGCIDLYFPAPEPGASVDVSATPCPSSGASSRWRTIAFIAAALLALFLPFLLLRGRRR
jgi:hypothetical protein